MNSLKTVLIAVLALTTVGGAMVAWRQYGELVELRALVMNREERADFQKKIWDLEKANRELRDQLAAAASENEAEAQDMLAEATEEGRGSDRERREGGDRRRGGPPPQLAAVRELMNKPEVRALLAEQQKTAIEERYGALFRNMNLSAEQAEKLKTLLMERQASRQDIFEVARAQGIDPRQNPEAFRKLMTDARNEIENSIKSVVGDAGYTQLQNYEQTMPQRVVVNELQQRLSHSTTPLTAAQSEQLVQILAANTPRPAAGTTPTTSRPESSGRGGSPGRPGPGGRSGPDFGRGADFGMLAGALGGSLFGAVADSPRVANSAPITPNAIQQAQGVLSQPQVTALQQLQQQQQNQQKLGQMIRETMRPQPTSSGQPQPGAAGGAAPQPRRGRPGGE